MHGLVLQFGDSFLRLKTLPIIDTLLSVCLWSVWKDNGRCKFLFKKMLWHSYIKHCHLVLNILWLSDAVWQCRSGSTLAQVMACCRLAPCHASVDPDFMYPYGTTGPQWVKMWCFCICDNHQLKCNDINSLHVELWKNVIKFSFSFYVLPLIKQVVEILPHGRQGPTYWYIICLIKWLLMTWWHKGLEHQQP